MLGPRAGKKCQFSIWPSELSPLLSNTEGLSIRSIPRRSGSLGSVPSGTDPTVKSLDKLLFSAKVVGSRYLTNFGTTGQDSVVCLEIRQGPRGRAWHNLGVSASNLPDGRCSGSGEHPPSLTQLTRWVLVPPGGHL